MSKAIAIIKIWCKETKSIVDDEEELMILAGFDVMMGFEDVGVQGDGTPVVFDKCGNFGYLDPNKYCVIIGVNPDETP